MEAKSDRLLETLSQGVINSNKRMTAYGRKQAFNIAQNMVLLQGAGFDYIGMQQDFVNK